MTDVARKRPPVSLIQSSCVRERQQAVYLFSFTGKLWHYLLKCKIYFLKRITETELVHHREFKPQKMNNLL